MVDSPENPHSIRVPELLEVYLYDPSMVMWYPRNVHEGKIPTSYCDDAVLVKVLECDPSEHLLERAENRLS